MEDTMVRVLSLVLLLVGCGGGKDTGPTTGTSTGAATGAATGSATGAATGSATGAATGTGTGTTTGTGTGATTGSATGTGTGSTTGTATGTTTASTCASGCHGSALSENPPPDTLGNTATTDRGVGAHETHLSGGLGGAPVACESCHLVPASVGDAGHVDTALPAELTFSGVAVTGGATPSFDGTALTCTGSYCHSGPGGSNPTPHWTTVNGTEAACGSCHSLPPPPPHSAATNCETCHSTTAGPGMTIANPATHVNGSVDF